jgi:hypothetical protein
MITIFLLRNKLLPLLEHVHHALLPDASLLEEDQEKPISRFSELLKEGVRYHVNGRDWLLHGTRKGQAPQILRMAHVDDLHYRQALAYVKKVAEAYAWCLLPWGVSFGGEMLAFISADQSIFNKFKKYALEGYCRDLEVSHYTAENLNHEQFKGAIFRRPVDLRAQALWKHARGPSSSVLALTCSSEDSRPPAAEVVCETPGNQFGNPVIRSWIRISDEHRLRWYLAGRSIIIVTASDLDERLMWLALQDFAEIADTVNQDPLYFGLKALESASWVYIPMNTDEKWEIYINKDPAVTTQFLQSKEVLEAPHSSHKYFC